MNFLYYGDNLKILRDNVTFKQAERQRQSRDAQPTPLSLTQSANALLPDELGDDE